VRVGLLSLLSILLCGCASRFEPLPVQRAPVEAPDPPPRPCLFSLADPAAAPHLVRDIPTDPAAGRRRWTGPQPEVRCTLPDAGPWLAAFDFEVIDTTFSVTGPITLTFSVNGREIARMRCDAPGSRRFRAPLLPDLNRAGLDVALTASIDKPFIASGDGARLGVLLSAAGFIHP